MIDFRNISKRYSSGFAVRKASFTVEKGELFVLLGESGSGKTTLLKMVNRLIEPTEGEVIVGDNVSRNADASELRRSIGYVIQQIGLLPHWTVGDNIALVPQLLGWARPDIDARVAELLTMIGLDPARHRHSMPDQLSGGQRQRVGLARALAARPKVLLMDEPLGAVDPLLRRSLQREIVRIHKELSLTTMMVTHDMVEGLTMADRAAVMRSGEVLQIGTPTELLRSPAHDYVADLMSVAAEHSAAVETLRAGAAAPTAAPATVPFSARPTPSTERAGT
ncbi:MAG: ABC transporter ATP-binding protein [Polyangiaceae bacterium]